MTFGGFGLLAIIISVVVMGGAIYSQSDNDKEDEDTWPYLAITFVLYWLGAVLLRNSAADVLSDLPWKGYVFWGLLIEFALTVALAYILGFIFKLVGPRRQGPQGG
jgi:hypothetical protein